MSNTLTSTSCESEHTAPAGRKDLVFFVGTDPEADPGPLQTAQAFRIGRGRRRALGRAATRAALRAPHARGQTVTVTPSG